mgnify:CR=1 FL=1
MTLVKINNLNEIFKDKLRILVKSLGDRIAEGLAEKMHLDVRKKYWGYAKNEKLENFSESHI